MPKGQYDRGSTSGGYSRLQKLLDYHRDVVRAIETTLTLLNGHAQASTARRAPDILTEAIAIDRARGQIQKQRGHDKKKRTTRPHGQTRSVRAQRQQSAAFLAQFSETEPRHPQPSALNRGMGSLVRRGYLRKKGTEGYVRTAKVYEIDGRTH